ncbi:MAG: DEAD/DEAH box helicase [Candidatus Lokiarchaeota archaeon]|nr:DEAD/DEAH box helicase [Candidatus Lokiarchaeota archaeon]
MEVADADIQRRLAKPYSLVLRDARQEMSATIELFSDVLRDRQRRYLGGMIEFGRKGNGLLEVRRMWFVKYNKPVYFQPKEVHQILRKAKHILVPKKHKPPFMRDLQDFLKRMQARKARVIPVCESCIRNDRLTILSKRNVVKVSTNEVACLSCARSDMHIDLKSIGAKLSKPMLRYMDHQLSRVKSVTEVVELLKPGFDPVYNSEITMYDELQAGKLVEGRSIDDLDIPDKLKDILKEDGLKQLLPVQELVVEAGLLKGEDLLIVSSTSSGKTLLGELAGIPQALEGKKLIYLSPLVALTNEKYNAFRKRYKKLGLRVGIRVGMSRIDIGKDGKVIVDTDVRKAQVICATYEALDLLFRSGENKQIGDIGTIIVDEIQNLAEEERGPELDGLLARMRFHYPKAQVLALSATVGSPEQLAKELKLKLVEYHGRPVPLERHLVFARNDEDKRRIIRRLVDAEFRTKSSSGNKGQSIIFTFSRRRAHSISDWLREHGIRSAVYHGGLSYNKRRSVEYSYAKQRYPCVVTTAALGAGVDLPASQVIFESLAMGADWISTAEFEQMLGRAGRLGKHDRGRVYLIVQPERKYHGGQDKYEDEIATELLAGDIENVEPFADTERCAEQILATICSTGLTELKSVARFYKQMLSATVPPSDALKHLVRTHMIRVREGGAHPTDLGKATSISFLTPSEGFDVAKHVKTMDTLEIAIKLSPFENAYLSNKLQQEVNAAFKTYMPTRLFSGVFSDISNVGTPGTGASRLPPWVFSIFGKWAQTFFKCECKMYPDCDHGKIEFGKWVVERRKEGLNPTGIARELRKEFEIWVYPGDIFSWLDSLIHHLKAVQRVAKVAGETDINEEIEEQIARIEKPKQESDKKQETEQKEETE